MIHHMIQHMISLLTPIVIMQITTAFLARLYIN